MSERKRVAVVGMGMAGLSAAWELVRGGASVVLYEERQEPGGRMRSEDLDGQVVDPAVQLVASTYGRLFNLAKEAGASGLLRRSPGRDALWRGGRAHTLTYGSVASMVASTALPTGLKVRLGARYLPFLARRARHLDANDPAHTGGAALDTASVAEWGRSELGEDFVELLAYPLLGAYYGGTPERISAALYHALARVGTDVRLYGVTGGVGAVPHAILAALRRQGAQWRGGEAVLGVEADGVGVVVRTAAGAERCDAAVIAVPAARAVSLLEAPPQLSRWLAGVQAMPTATLALLLEERPRGDFFGLSFPRRSRVGETIVAACLGHRKLPDLVPHGRGVIVVYPAPAIAAEIAAAEPDAAVDRLLPPLEEAFAGVSRRVNRARLYRMPEGYTLFYPGYLRHILTYDASWLPPTVALAGDYLVAPTVEGAAVSGARAARRILQASRR